MSYIRVNSPLLALTPVRVIDGTGTPLWLKTENWMPGVGGLFGWVWESPEVTAFEGERFACLW
jgi:hypothetical protein